MNDRRRAARHRIDRHAKIHCGAGSLPRDCLVTDISDTGVRLHSETFAVPDSFVLMLSGAATDRRECRVVWRLGYEVGAEFTDVFQAGFASRAAAGQSAQQGFGRQNSRRTA
ncbi:MAG TPA: PilZ domain-containing protein [Xanthobacteraceae bacterium]|nr:PilZ domain-containing protein [Xanthobacteraceae bacterium]